MTTTRRNLFKILGGSAAGALFTPAPWRLITDTALWSENWPGIPRPARGEIRAKFTNCLLCPAGCAVRARCVGEQPVALAGVGGGLCPFGLTAHHLPYHPARLKEGPVKEAAAAVAEAAAKCGPGERVAVLDLRPGRTASWTYRRAMAAARGLYIAPAESAVAVDLASAKTVLSLGAPLLDGWGTPARVFAARDGFRLIQAEAVESRTAALADVWLPVRPGAEESIVRGLAGTLSHGEAAEAAGIEESQMEWLARELTEKGPALVVDGTMSPAVVALNVQLGGWGRTIGPRREAPVPDAWKTAAAVTDLAAVPDGSIRALVIDESAPGAYVAWEAIERKLVRDHPVVVTLAWSRNGYGRHTEWVLPAAVYPEATGDVAAAIDDRTPAFRPGAPLVAAPAGVVNPAEFIAGAAGMAAGDALRERADAIHRTGRGTLLTYSDGKKVPIKEMKADDFWKALNAGGRWTGEGEASGPAPKVVAEAAQAAAGLSAEDLPFAIEPAEARVSPLVSPLMSKVYQESNLRLAPNGVMLHPRDARACGVEAGGRALLMTAYGRREVEIRTDSSVRPGVVVVAGWPDGGAARAKVVRI